MGLLGETWHTKMQINVSRSKAQAFDHFYITQKTRESKKEIGEIRESSFSDYIRHHWWGVE